MMTAIPATAPLRAIAEDAVANLSPIVVVNRRVDTALDQVAGSPSQPFSTIHTDPPPGVLGRVERTIRGVNERLRGTHGDGPDAGRTIYGSVRFVASDDVSAGATAVLDALAKQGDVGVRAYGPVSFVVSPGAVRDRMTIAADDSGATFTPVRPVSDLPEVIIDRLKRSDGAGGAPTIDHLRQLEPAAARDAIRGWLLSDSLGTSGGYMEAQVRRLAPTDLLGTIIDTRPSDEVRRLPGIDPGPPPVDEDVGRLQEQLHRHGLPTKLLR